MFEMRHGGTYHVARDVLFDFIREPRNWPAMFHAVDEVAYERWEVPGDTCEVLTSPVGRQRVVTVTLRELVRPRLLAYTGHGPRNPDLMCQLMLVQLPTGTQVDALLRMEPRAGFAGIIDQVVGRPVLQRMGDEGMRKLGEQLADEPHTPTVA